MNRIFCLLSMIVLGGCVNSHDPNAVCTDIPLEVVGDVRVFDEYIEGPFWGGRGPYGPAIAVVLKVDPLLKASTSPHPTSLILFPSQGSMQNSDDQGVQCARQISSGSQKIVCDAVFFEQTVFLRSSFDGVEVKKDVEVSPYAKTSKNIAKEIESKALGCQSSKKWQGV